MSPVKRFLISYCVIYVVLCGLGITLFKSPTFSGAYLAKYKVEHEQFHAIIKSEPYKIWKERPALHPPSAELKKKIDFVAEYEERPEFKAEEHRVGLYRFYFKWMNALMFIWMLVHFARKPLCDFLDSKIAEIRTTIEQAERQREEAAQKYVDVQEKLKTFPGLAAEIQKKADADIEVNLQHISEEGKLSEHQLTVEIDDRKREDWHEAATTIRHELVTQALARVEERYRTEPSLKNLEHSVDEFVSVLEQIS